MIDRKARDNLAENFRHLVTGQITNDQFEDRLVARSADAGVNEVYYRGAWPLYDDLYEHKLSGKHAISEEGKPVVARFILFLKTNLEYEWPRRTGAKEVPWAFLAIFTLGLSAVIRNRIRTKGERGDHTVWPFYRRHDYEQALKETAYLGNG